ncbi:MAG: glutamine--tRNA ligase/YqeY domain fusion protein [Myxococcales bacterium]|nr:glutamine--tRNA ligase/YqeY domain fusion protein [Myxococcales bacterium]
MTSKPSDFIRDIIDADLASGKHTEVKTRFPPEPNGYLHIGHAKSICLNFGLAKQYGGQCNLRFDDTNPAKEDQEYVDSICADVRWLGFDYGSEALFASDYFETFYSIALKLIREGKAYVCSLNEEEIREYRGSLKEAGTASPHRSRTVDENLDLFARMRVGEFKDGAHVLRAKIDMGASNMKMRDPLLYRIRHQSHHRTGDTWCLYPMYDFAHPLEDALEGITHSICTLEFENNRPLYDWVVANSALPGKPEQTEFARLGLDYSVMSKRKLFQLVEQERVSGWDDPRMLTVSGMRRRGYRPEAIVRFCDLIGVSKNNSTVDMGKLEYVVRDDLNPIAPRVMAVLRPIKLVINNYEAGKSEALTVPFFPPDIGKPGEREVHFGRELYIESTDFEEEPSKGFRRMAPGRWIRLRYGYCVRCDEVIKNDDGEVVEVRCSYDDSTLGGTSPEGEKVWGIIHWVNAADSLPAEIRIYDRLFSAAAPDAGGNFLDYLNSDSLETLEAWVEPCLAGGDVGPQVQFERQGYFVPDSVDSRPDALVFNRIVGLKDSWSKKAVAEPSTPAEKPKSARSATRPKSRSKAEIRGAARYRDATLASRFIRYQDVGLSEGDADVLTGSLTWGDRLEALNAAGMPWDLAAKWLLNEHPREGDDPIEFASDVSEFLVVTTASGTLITTTSGSKLWGQLAREPGSAKALIKSQGLEQVSDDASIQPIIDKVIADNASKASAYRGGKDTLMGFFIGQVMRASKGKANAEKVKELLLAALA